MPKNIEWNKHIHKLMEMGDKTNERVLEVDHYATDLKTPASALILPTLTLDNGMKISKTFLL